MKSNQHLRLRLPVLSPWPLLFKHGCMFTVWPAGRVCVFQMFPAKRLGVGNNLCTWLTKMAQCVSMAMTAERMKSESPALPVICLFTSVITTLIKTVHDLPTSAPSSSPISWSRFIPTQGHYSVIAKFFTTFWHGLLNWSIISELNPPELFLWT